MNLKMELRYFPLIILEIFLQPTVHVRAQTKHEGEGIICRPLRQDCLEAHFCCFEGPNKHSCLLASHLSLPDVTWRTIRPRERKVSGLLRQIYKSQPGWWQHHAVGMSFSSRKQSGKRRRWMYRGVLDENLLQRTLDLGWGFIFQKVTDPEHTAEISQEWLQDNSVNVLEWASQSTDLNPLEHLCGDLKITVHDALHPTWWSFGGAATRSLGQPAQNQVYQACGIIFKKSWSCDCCQRRINKLLYCEFLDTIIIFFYY